MVDNDIKRLITRLHLLLSRLASWSTSGVITVQLQQVFILEDGAICKELRVYMITTILNSIKRKVVKRDGVADTMFSLISVTAMFILLLSPISALACDKVAGEYLIRFNTQKVRQAAPSNDRQRSIGSLVNPYLRRINIEQLKHRYSFVNGLLHVKSSAINEEEIKNLLSEGIVEYVEPNCRRYKRGDLKVIDRAITDEQQQLSYSTRETPNDPYYGNLWGLHNTGTSGGIADIDIDAPEAWDVLTDSSSVVVAVVDSGVDINHEDLSTNIWTNEGETANNGIDDDGNGYIDDKYGYNAIDEDGDVVDSMLDGHGTHVAGTIGAIGNNGVGIVGVNWKVKILPVRVFKGDLGGDIATILGAWDYVATLKADGVNVRVLNNSFGYHGENPSQAEVDAVEAGGALGLVYVFSSGNDGENNDIKLDTSNFSLDNVLSVASVNKKGALSSFSNYGDEYVHIAAPGESITSTFPGNEYAVGDGTSFAAPFVTGVVAMVATKNPTYTAAQLRSSITSNAYALSSLAGKTTTGGMVNAALALGVTPGTEDPVPTPDPGTGSTPDGSDIAPTCEPVAASAPSRPVADADGDGVSDVVEQADGTDPSDAGSYKAHMSSPVYLLWTGFLNITPIAEIFNPGTSTLTVRVTLFDISGNARGELTKAIATKGQWDLIVSQLEGFEQDSYGLLRVDYCGSSLGGRVAYYRAGSDNDYEFVYSQPINNPTYGSVAASFNTMQPSLNPTEGNNLVANWLTIVNLSDEQKTFTYRKYSLNGTLINTSTISMSGMSRRDIEAGHENPGPSNVGLITIEPTDIMAPYLSMVTRFGYNVAVGEIATGYNFAFPLQLMHATGKTVYVPLTTTLNTQNWLEVFSVIDSSTSVNVKMYRSTGDKVFDETQSLGARRQWHIDVNSQLGDSQVGYAEIVPTTQSSILAQSMVYMRDMQNGSIRSMYGSHAQELLGTNYIGSYNLFLGMTNWLKIINPSSSNVTATLTIYTMFGTSSQTVTIDAMSSKDLGLHESQTYGTYSNTYGVVSVEAANSAHLIAQLLRVRNASDGQVDFAFPTEVRDTE